MRAKALIGLVFWATTAAAAVDYGPAPVNAQETIEVWIAENALDPSSMQVRWVDTPRAGTMADFTSAWPKKRAGWLYCIEHNGKNRYGGFTGWQRHAFLIYQNQVIAHTDKFTDDYCGRQ